MSEYFMQYEALMRKLSFIRWIHDGYETEDEESVLDEMDELWWKLSDCERAAIDNAKPKSLIRSGSHSADKHREGNDVDIYNAPPGSPVRILERAS